MKTLSKKEMKSVTGGFLNIAVVIAVSATLARQATWRKKMSQSKEKLQDTWDATFGMG